jgi:hypothetical protein
MVNMLDLFCFAQIYLKEGRIEDAISKFTESHNLSEELGLGYNNYHITCLEIFQICIINLKETNCEIK